MSLYMYFVLLLTFVLTYLYEQCIGGGSFMWNQLIGTFTCFCSQNPKREAVNVQQVQINSWRKGKSLDENLIKDLITAVTMSEECKRKTSNIGPVVMHCL